MGNRNTTWMAAKNRTGTSCMHIPTCIRERATFSLNPVLRNLPSPPPLIHVLLLLVVVPRSSDLALCNTALSERGYQLLPDQIFSSHPLVLLLFISPLGLVR